MGLLQALNLPPLPKRAVSAPDVARLTAAADAWRQALREAAARVKRLQGAVRSQCAGEAPALLGQVEKGLTRLDGLLGPVDQGLADALSSAAKATDDRARQDGLKKAKSLVAAYIGHLNSEPLVAHIDRNPFGVKTEIKALLATGLTGAAKAIG